MCEYCAESNRKEINIKESPLFKSTQPTKALIVKLPNDKPGIVLFTAGVSQGYMEIEYCPICSRKLD